MNIETIKVKKLYNDAKVPKLGSTFAAGSDLHAYIKDPNYGSILTINPHETRIAQIVFVPYISPIFEEVTELSNTDRGEWGFGSTGIK